MKYYIYISDAKVDMLFPQVPHEIKKKVSTELGFDLKLLSAKRKVETESDDNRIARLETVVEFIREYGNLGSGSKPDEYFEDTLPMSFYSFTKDLGIGAPPVYLSGWDESHSRLIALGGSARHLIGGFTPSDVQVSDSIGITILENLRQILGEKGRKERAATTSDLSVVYRLEKYQEYNETDATKRGTELIDFFAKRLASGDKSDDCPAIVLGTPLYLAKAD